MLHMQLKDLCTCILVVVNNYSSNMIKITHNNRIKIARIKRGLGPRCRSAVYAGRYAPYSWTPAVGQESGADKWNLLT